MTKIRDISSSADVPKCACCEQNLLFQWSDYHGVAVCITCGMPYQIIHYDEITKRRVERPAEMRLTEEGLQVARRYWSEKRMRVFPGYYDMGVSANGRTYSGATRAEIEAFFHWYTEQYPTVTEPA